MSFRLRLFATMSLAALVPLLAFAWGVRSEMEHRLLEQSQQRADDHARRIRADLQREGRWIGARLRTLAADVERDARLRRALRGDAAERTTLLDWAEGAMRLSGLSMLQLQDETGRILSSGHFRNEFDRIDAELPRRLAAVPGGTAFVPSRTAEGSLLALARVDSFRLASRPFTLVGGLAADSTFLGTLERAGEIRLSLLDADGSPLVREAPWDSLAPVHYLTQIMFPLVSSGASTTFPGPARLVLTQSLDAMLAAQRSLDLWFAAIAATSLFLALGIASLVAARIGRPLAALAQKTALVDLQRLDVDFHSERNDEIGALSRLLQSMTERLRASARHLRAAERRAAVGDLARQVNHDIKNGLVPIRNVLSHLARVAEHDPEALPGVFRERRSTLDSGIEYLETLAAHYARLTPPALGGVCDANQAVADVARGAATPGIAVQLRLAPQLPGVRCDPVALRRILENLLGNALDSFAGPHGTVTVATAATAQGVEICVSDTGRGMTASEIEQAFHDFHTTKEHGTGLGLSIVRRLVRDAGGQVHVESTPGAGSHFRVQLPAAEAPSPASAAAPRETRHE